MKTARKPAKTGRSEAKTAPTREPEMPRSLLLKTAEVVQMVGISRVTLWRMWTTGLFPRPVVMNARVTRFRRDDVEKWIAGGCKRVSQKVRETKAQGSRFSA